MSDFNSRKTTPSPRPRQRPGAACEECRRRKLRCDRRQPQCGLCEASNVECHVVTARPARGPKRGYLKALQARIAALEGALIEQQHACGTMNGSADHRPLGSPLLEDQLDLSTWQLPMIGGDSPIQTMYTDNKTTSDRTSSGTFVTDGSGSSAMTSISPPNTFVNITEDLATQEPHSNPKGSESPEDNDISEFMQADLDQLFFDRIQTFMPIQHQSRYFAWRRLPVKTPSQSCLQHAIWTLAASVSALYQNIGDTLYQRARHGLEELESKNTGITTTDIEQVQAWLLVAIYEFMAVDFRRGWLSAGRAFRLIQLNWLQGMDGTDVNRVQSDWIDAEQKRRTFWMAYCLDRFVSMRTGSPPTFSERVAIRMPSPEANFQNDQPILMGFLSDVLANIDPTVTSSFTECIIVATISGRALSHRHQCLVGDIFFRVTEDFWNRHQWISAVLTQMMDAFSSKYPADLQQTDPMLLFIGLMWRTVVLHLYQTMACVVSPTDEKREFVADYKKRASAAIQDIIDLTNNISRLSSLKVHPLSLIPVSVCVGFLVIYQRPGDTFSRQLQEITEALRGLKRFNNLGHGVLQLCEDHILTSQFQSSSVH